MVPFLPFLIAKESMITITLPPLWVLAACGVALLTLLGAILVWLVFRRPRR